MNGTCKRSAIFLIAFAILTSLCISRKALAEDKVLFRVTKRLSSVVAHIAVAEGFFEEEGLDVELVFWDNSSSLIPMLAKGKLDVSMTGPFDSAYINVIERGARIRLVAARTIHATDGCGYFSFVARSELIDSGRLDDLSSLRGLRVATDRTSSSYYYWTRLLGMANLTMDDVEIVDIPSAMKPEAMAKNLVDISTQSEPWNTRTLHTGKGRIWRPVSDILPDHQSTFLVFGRRLLDDRPDLGIRFMTAYMRAVRLYEDKGKTERNIDIVASQTKLERDELQEMCWPRMSADGYIGGRSLQEYQEWAVEEGLIDAIVPREQLVDDRFLPKRADQPKTAKRN